MNLKGKQHIHQEARGKKQKLKDSSVALVQEMK
jgi:hypothetical protein